MGLRRSQAPYPGAPRCAAADTATLLPCTGAPPLPAGGTGGAQLPLSAPRLMRIGHWLTPAKFTQAALGPTTGAPPHPAGGTGGVHCHWHRLHFALQTHSVLLCTAASAAAAAAVRPAPAGSSSPRAGGSWARTCLPTIYLSLLFSPRRSGRTFWLRHGLGNRKRPSPWGAAKIPELAAGQPFGRCGRFCGAAKNYAFECADLNTKMRRVRDACTRAIQGMPARSRSAKR